ncbi:hypothetical protein FNF27_06758 [Cafeteria roenbergensis]|uniref:Uncharacterized protein n=1 Tax=Cafeteria roenbergensis TaxID=33653 RepID=A0A5A8DWX8_CAFRO|nr:hypothetical protein FNF27_06758 [Cafeteria roenbergensis]
MEAPSVLLFRADGVDFSASLDQSSIRSGARNPAAPAATPGDAASSVASSHSMVAGFASRAPYFVASAFPQGLGDADESHGAALGASSPLTAIGTNTTPASAATRRSSRTAATPSELSFNVSDVSGAVRADESPAHAASRREAVSTADPATAASIASGSPATNRRLFTSPARDRPFATGDAEQPSARGFRAFVPGGPRRVQPSGQRLHGGIDSRPVVPSPRGIAPGVLPATREAEESWEEEDRDTDSDGWAAADGANAAHDRFDEDSFHAWSGRPDAAVDLTAEYSVPATRSASAQDAYPPPCAAFPARALLATGAEAAPAAGGPGRQTTAARHGSSWDSHGVELGAGGSSGASSVAAPDSAAAAAAPAASGAHGAEAGPLMRPAGKAELQHAGEDELAGEHSFHRDNDEDDDDDVGDDLAEYDDDDRADRDGAGDTGVLSDLDEDSLAEPPLPTPLTTTLEATPQAIALAAAQPETLPSSDWQLTRPLSSVGAFEDEDEDDVVDVRGRVLGRGRDDSPSADTNPGGDGIGEFGDDADSAEPFSRNGFSSANTANAPACLAADRGPPLQLI